MNAGDNQCRIASIAIMALGVGVLHTPTPSAMITPEIHAGADGPDHPRKSSAAPSFPPLPHSLTRHAARKSRLRGSQKTR
jgi:hypothetical protein